MPRDQIAPPHASSEPAPDAPSSRRLRVGVLVDGLIQPLWIAEAIERIVKEGHAEIVVVVLNVPSSTAEKPSRLRSWIRNRRALGYGLYNRLDAWWFPVGRDPFPPVDISSLLAGAPRIEVKPRRTTFSDYFDDADVEQLLGHDLDVAIRFGFRILRGRALTVARHGVWSYHHGDNRVNRGGPPGFWEVMDRHPVTGAVLQVLSESLDDGRVLMRAWSKTDRFSVARNRARYYWQAAPLVARALRNLAATGEAGVVTETHPVAYGERLYGAPGNTALLRRLSGLAFRYVRGHIRAALSREQWIIGYRHAGTTPDRAQQGLPDLAPHRFRMLVPPNDRSWADPFPIRVGGRDFVFFEEDESAAGKAHIAWIEVDEQGQATAPRTALTCDYHLSYPFVFEWEGQHYMIPETEATRRVELWRAVSFPDQWELAGILLEDRPLVDATVACIGGRWWLFAAGTETGGEAWDDLFLFHATSPLGPWIPHRANPVISDVRSARPAGRLFQHCGHWYRPAQDGSRVYGGAITIQRIDQLDEHAYQETAVTRLEPHWRPDLVATHSINSSGPLTVIDARRRRWLWQR
ncbi:MAG: glucosamine inositolphosphorylceramide transferase family protein [Gemmatimonadaceae bacterium]